MNHLNHQEAHGRLFAIGGYRFDCVSLDPSRRVLKHHLKRWSGGLKRENFKFEQTSEIKRCRNLEKVRETMYTHNVNKVNKGTCAIPKVAL